MKNGNIMIVGVGGQGTLLPSRIIGGVMFNAGCDVKISEVHGMAQRGGSVVSFVRFGEKVYAPTIEVGQADILIAFEPLEALRYEHFLSPNGIIIVNDRRIVPMSVITGEAKYPDNIVETLSEKHRVYSVNAMDEALKLGNSKVANIIVLGMLARNIDLAKEEWLKVIEETAPPASVEINKAAFLKGLEL